MILSLVDHVRPICLFLIVHHCGNGQDKITWKIFIITRNVGDIEHIQTTLDAISICITWVDKLENFLGVDITEILNLVERNQLKPLDMPISVSNFITGMVTDKSCR